jgi:hypothetical protein
MHEPMRIYTTEPENPDAGKKQARDTWLISHNKIGVWREHDQIVGWTLGILTEKDFVLRSESDFAILRKYEVVGFVAAAAQPVVLHRNAATPFCDDADYSSTPKVEEFSPTRRVEALVNHGSFETFINSVPLVRCGTRVRRHFG